MTKDVQERRPDKPDGPKPSAQDPALRRPLRLWGARVLVGLAVLVAAGMFAVGILSHTFLMLAVPGAGIFLLALGLAGLLRWRTSRPWRSVCVAVWAGALGVLVVIYVFAWQPLRIMRAGQYWRVQEYGFPEPDPAEVRSVCHRLLTWSLQHDACIYIATAGDETSVPYLLWALTWHDQGDCSTQHAYAALATITNNASCRTLEAWKEWYEKNRRRSQMTWWADGFVAEGYKAFPYEGTEGPKAARELLAALGRATWLEPPSREYLTFNAVRMLKKLPAADVRKAMGEALKGESPAEKRGLARYTEHLSREVGEPMLKTLAADSDRSVRLAATGQTCANLAEQWRAKDSDAVWRLCQTGQVPPEVLAEAPARAGTTRPGAPSPAATSPAATAPATTTAPAVACPQAGGSSNVRGPAELPKAIREVLNPPPSGTIAAGTHGKTVWLIRAEGLKAQGGPTDANSWRGEPYVLHVEGWSPQTGRRVYSRQLANSRTDRADSVCWLLDAPTGRLYVSIPTYTAAIDVETGEVAWEIGFGVTGSGDLLVLGPFVTLQCGPGCIVFGAVEGEIVVSTGWQDVRLDPARFRLLDGRLWARDSDGRWYFLDFSNTHAPWSEPAEQELPGNASERAAQPPRENASEPARMR